LGPEDFGEYKAPLLALFGGVAVGAFFVARDFLAIRGVAILLLLAARPALDAGANDPHPRRVFLNALIYGLIVLALWLGAAPFYWRDFWEWAMEKPARPRALGGALVAYGLLLAFVATTYGS
jgi:hypothetical protein